MCYRTAYCPTPCPADRGPPLTCPEDAAVQWRGGFIRAEVRPLALATWVAPGPRKAQADHSARVPGGMAAGLSTRGFVFGAL